LTGYLLLGKVCANCTHPLSPCFMMHLYVWLKRYWHYLCVCIFVVCVPTLCRCPSYALA
jgi:hypothetical protein